MGRTSADPPARASTFGGRLDAAAGRNLTRALLDAALDADLRGRVEPRSIRLCAALGELAGCVYDALAARPDEALRGRVTEAAAALSLLTKVDDQVIDGRAFHGGHATPRDELRRATAAYLAPTLESIRAARPRGPDARCTLAAFTGERMRDLATDPSRLARMHGLVARGWETQVDAVVTLTTHPRDVDVRAVARVTPRISGLWLGMVSAVGALPLAAPSAPRSRWLRGFLRWGRWIQQADALADLARDLDDGLVATAVTRGLWSRAPREVDDAIERGDPAVLYALLARHRVDEAMLPSPAELARASADLAGLGELPALLGWIRQYLLGRYEAHPLRVARHEGGDRCSAP